MSITIEYIIDGWDNPFWGESEFVPEIGELITLLDTRLIVTDRIIQFSGRQYPNVMIRRVCHEFNGED
jgi:hypothetical protein